MIKLENKSILEEDALDELQNPRPQKKRDDRTIVLSRNDYGRNATINGIPSIIDFDLAVKGNGLNYGPIQVEHYRTPEVILNAGWTYSSDIWNLGVIICPAASCGEERLHS